MEVENKIQIRSSLGSQSHAKLKEECHGYPCMPPPPLPPPSRLKLHYKALVLQTAWLWHKSRPGRQVEDRGINPHRATHSLTTGEKPLQQINGAGENWIKGCMC